jgi:adenosylhomocysteine nucleosidase
VSILVVAALASEAAYLPDGLPLVLTGVGKTAAATAVTRALAETPGITEVLNIGTAGSLRDDLHGLHLPGTVINHDISADALRALGLDPMDTLDVPGGEETILASGDMFVADPEERTRLARRAHLVDMEGYAVAWACRGYDVPVRLVKHVSDNADLAAMTWPQLVDASARELGAWVADYVG